MRATISVKRSKSFKLALADFFAMLLAHELAAHFLATSAAWYAWGTQFVKFSLIELQVRKPRHERLFSALCGFVVLCLPS